MWTNLPGFPLVRVTKVGTSVSISQEPFKPADFLAILDDPNNKNISNLSQVTTPSTTTTTTTQSSSAKNKKPTKWIFPINYVTNVENVSDSLWFTSVDSTSKGTPSR